MLPVQGKFGSSNFGHFLAAMSCQIGVYGSRWVVRSNVTPAMYLKWPPWFRMRPSAVIRFLCAAKNRQNVRQHEVFIHFLDDFIGGLPLLIASRTSLIPALNSPHRLPPYNIVAIEGNKSTINFGCGVFRVRKIAARRRIRRICNRRPFWANREGKVGTSGVRQCCQW